MKAKTALQALEQLEKNRGWAYIRAIMEREILDAAMNIAKRPNMTMEEIHYRRGAIWAAERLVELPDRLRFGLQNKIALDPDGDDTIEPTKDYAALNATNPAKAGKE